MRNSHKAALQSTSSTTPVTAPAPCRPLALFCSSTEAEGQEQPKAYFRNIWFENERKRRSQRAANNDPSGSTFLAEVELKDSSPWLSRLAAKKSSPREVERAFLDWLGEKLSYSRREDWYNISKQDFLENKGEFVLRNHSMSPFLAVTTIFSDHKFTPWLFKSLPSSFFKSRDNRRQYISWLREVTGVDREDQLTVENYRSHSGSSLLNLYGWSPKVILEDSLSEPSLTSSNRPRKFWASMENQRAFLNEVGAQIGVKGSDLSPWYRVDHKTLSKLGAGGLLRTYNDSHSKMLAKVYPEFDWQPWKFNFISQSALDDPEVVERALAYVEKSRQIAGPEDWYRVSEDYLYEIGLRSFLGRAGGLLKLLQKFRPKHPWDPARFIGIKGIALH